MMSTLQMAKELRKRVDKRFRDFILSEMPKAEAYLLELGYDANDPDQQVLLRTYSRMCWNLNFQLGIITEAIDYPVNQWDWKDSRPLEILSRFFPGIQETDWYQRQMGMMMIPKKNHLYNIITLSMEKQYLNSQKAKEIR